MHGPQSDIRKDKRRSLLSIATNVVLLALSYVGILAFGTLTARLATEGTALSNHPDCGIYDTPTSLSDKVGLRAMNLMKMLTESDSAKLAEKCFHAKPGSDGCNFFLQPSISYVQSNAECPFRDHNICLGKGSHVVRFSTGPIRANSALGLNAPISLEFARETTCSPLVTDSQYVHGWAANDSTVFYYYEYGRTTDSKYTMITPNPPRHGMPSTYRVGSVALRQLALEVCVADMRKGQK